jgi:hypothetical protein
MNVSMKSKMLFAVTLFVAFEARANQSAPGTALLKSIVPTYVEHTTTSLSRLPVIEDMKTLQKAFALGVDVSQFRSEFEQSLLNQNGEVDFRIADLLMAHGLSVETIIKDNKTALDLAVEARNGDLVEHLMAWGADPHCSPSNCGTKYPSHKFFDGAREQLKAYASIPSEERQKRFQAKAADVKRALNRDLEFVDERKIRNLSWKQGQSVVSQAEQQSLAINEPVMFVTHMSNGFTGAERVIGEVDKAIAHEKTLKKKIVYLMVNPDDVGAFDEHWQTKDTKPNYAMHSTAGEHFAQIKTHDLSFVGGYQDACLGNTMYHSLSSFFFNNPVASKPLNLTIYPNAVFSTNTRSMARWIKGKTAAVSDPNKILSDALFQDLKNRFQDLGQRATLNFIVDGKPIGVRGSGPQIINYRIENTIPTDSDVPEAIMATSTKSH